MTPMAACVLIVEDDADLGFLLQEVLKREGHRVEVVETRAEALERLRRGTYDLLLSDLKLPDGDGLELLAHYQELAPDVPIIVMTAFSTRQIALEATRKGAYDFFSKPFQIQEVQIVIRRALERRWLQAELKALRRSQPGTACAGIVGESPALRRVLRVAQQVAPTELTVLIEGESGTGKEVLARAIHQQSARRGGPFVAVNCAAIPEGLMESELFGHEKGAFTGAWKRRAGKFELARSGTLLLDEIGDMPVYMQAKLLRVLQEKEFDRVGGERPLATDARIIAATNRDVDHLVQEGKFREDLAYRLQGVRLCLPPLRERLEDLPLLIEHFLELAKARCGVRAATLTPSAMEVLWAFRWPGNLRQLQHVLEGALLIAEDGVIRPEHLPQALREPAPRTSHAHSLDEQLTAQERECIVAALQKTGGVQARAARALGITERSLWYRLKKLGIEPTGVKEPA
jgi:two-component system, NtrC family, response regulator AtoC